MRELDSEKVMRAQVSQATGARRVTKNAKASQVRGEMSKEVSVLVNQAMREVTMNDGWVASEWVWRGASVLDKLSTT